MLYRRHSWGPCNRSLQAASTDTVDGDEWEQDRAESFPLLRGGSRFLLFPSFSLWRKKLLLDKRVLQKVNNDANFCLSAYYFVSHFNMVNAEFHLRRKDP